MLLRFLNERVPLMSISTIDAATPDTELKLDLTGLLGSTQVFAAGNDSQLQAELIDANCNKIGEVTCA